ncbi:MAG: O-antigen ligase family protein, partial [Thermoguttaceae bacterium]|nr:O-antigen ligase family protein [Thermoguttaceae bacterium]
MSPALSLFALNFLKTTSAMTETQTTMVDLTHKDANGVFRTREIPWTIRLLRDCVDLFNHSLVFWTCVCGLIFGAIAAALAVGALAAAAAALLTALITLGLGKQQRRFAALLALPIVVGAASLFWLEVDKQVDSNLSAMVFEETEGEGSGLANNLRWPQWTEAIKLFKEDYPIVGSGLGSYYIAIRNRDEAMKRENLFYHAENIFVETAVEMGICGLVVLFIGYAILIFFLGRMFFGNHGEETRAAAIGGLALVIGQIVAGCSDFGIYIASNMYLFVVLCASLVTRQDSRYWEQYNRRMRKFAGNPEAVAQLERENDRRERRGVIGAIVVTAFLAIGAACAIVVIPEA